MLILLGTDFYEAFYEFNKDNPDPLYLIHGVWIDDYAQNSHMDAYDPAYLGRFKEDARTVVDVIHGQRWIELGRLFFFFRNGHVHEGHLAMGARLHPGRRMGGAYRHLTPIARTRAWGTYHGSYVSSTSEASAFEIMLAQVGDDLMGYESKRYKQQRLLAFSNWPTTDPMSYPLPLQLFFEKYSQVDVENIVAEETVVSGMFASYHVYPYYPDYLQYLPNTPTLWTIRAR